MTDDIRILLARIVGRHAAKKRSTVIKLAFAKANQQPLAPIFSQEDVCTERVWYQKWQHDPLLAEAFEACYQRAMEWADEETAALEAHYRRDRRKSVARYAAQAPAALAAVMASEGQRGNDRIRAAIELIGLAEPDSPRPVAFPVEVSNLDDVAMDYSSLTDEQLRAIIAGRSGEGVGVANTGA